MTAAVWFANILTVYAGLGAVFAIAFLIAGIHRVDPVAKGSSFWFRVFIFPGVAALWPLLLVRWMSVE